MIVDAGPRLVVDFESIIEGLRRGGFRLATIARETGIARTTLIDYLINGAMPLHANGERLIEFYCRAMLVERRCLPRRRWYPSVRQSAIVGTPTIW